MRVAIIGAGWAGLAAAVTVGKAGHQAIVFEASRTLGGRARALQGTLPDGCPVMLDNGQHILIGAYTETLALMHQVGINPEDVLTRVPLTLRFPDGTGISLPHWPAPWDALTGILGARGWTVRDKLSLLRAALHWQFNRFACPADATVSSLCAQINPTVMAGLIEPLCVSALNTPAHEASGEVFLRVIRDSLFGVAGGSHLLLPRTDLSALFPDAAANRVRVQGGEVRLGERVNHIQCEGTQWRVNHEKFDSVVLATPATESVRALVDCAQTAPENIAIMLDRWVEVTNALRFEAITTVYAYGGNAALPHPMLSLRSHPSNAPAQFVFDRGQLGGPAGLLAFVVSASPVDRDLLQKQVLTQAQEQLGLSLHPVQTVVEKRATFACTPALVRPPMQIAPGLLACGDYVAGPYPATLEGAVRSGLGAGGAVVHLPGS